MARMKARKIKLLFSNMLSRKKRACEAKHRSYSKRVCTIVRGTNTNITSRSDTAGVWRNIVHTVHRRRCTLKKQILQTLGAIDSLDEFELFYATTQNGVSDPYRLKTVSRRLCPK